MVLSKHVLAKTLLVALPLMFAGRSALGYVDLAPTLAKITSDSRKITLVEVVEYDRPNHTVVLKEVRALKGELASDLIRHDVASAPSASTQPAEGSPAGGVVPRQVLQWAVPGARGVLFGSRTTSLLCLGPGWYSVRASGNGTWKLGADRPDLPLAYYGSVSRLTDAIDRMLAGKDAVLTVVAFGAENEGASFDLALNRAALPGLIRLQRIRATLNMPGMVSAASSNPAYFIGLGVVDENDVQALIDKLHATDPLVRAEAADDLRTLGHKAKGAVPTLTALLTDAAPTVRIASAAALLRIASPQTQTLDVLSQGLASTDPSVRLAAARETGLAGPAVAPLVDKLSSLLNDSYLRITALQALAMLGPTAASAVPAITPLLDDPAYQVDAADALGRIGAAARPALGKMAQMLASDQAAIRWAAVRGMAQIGGPDAHPAVEFMIRAFPKATEVEGYNMMIYLSLLGPVAKDAVPAIQSTRIKNPVLPSATLWAIAPEKSLPWQSGGRFGGPPGGGGGGGGDIFSFVYQAYVRELGDRLRPTAKLLAQKIMDGSAGEVPAWGYEILTCGPDEALAVLTPHLADSQLQMRERAALGLGQMGPAAASAKEPLRTAIEKAANEQEKRMLQWALRQVGKEE